MRRYFALVLLFLLTFAVSAKAITPLSADAKIKTQFSHTESLEVADAEVTATKFGFHTDFDFAHFALTVSMLLDASTAQVIYQTEHSPYPLAEHCFLLYRVLLI